MSKRSALRSMAIQVLAGRHSVAPEVPESYLRPREPKSEEEFWVDPDQNSTGILLSDRISFYCERVGLIVPYDQMFVEPASYTLHAGREYIIAKKSGHYECRSLEKERTVVIPPNGLIYIRFYEEVNIPHYMIARFNLRVSQVYRGLLLGTGPQVDPGFRGYLGCPIHNFTDEPKTIGFFDPLVTIDFEKTTKFGEQSLADGARVRTADEYASMRSGATPVIGHAGHPCKIFNKRVASLFPSYLPPGESVRSSVHALHKEVTSLGRQVRWGRRIGYLALLGLIFAGFQLGLPLYTNVKDDITNRFSELKKELGELGRTVGRLEAERGGVAQPANTGKAPKSKASP